MHYTKLSTHAGLPGWLSSKGPSSSAGDAGDTEDVGVIPGLGRSPGGGHGNPLQCSCLENPMDRGAWQATVHRMAQSEATGCEHGHAHHHLATTHPQQMWLIDPSIPCH